MNVTNCKQYLCYLENLTFQFKIQNFIDFFMRGRLLSTILKYRFVHMTKDTQTKNLSVEKDTRYKYDRKSAFSDFTEKRNAIL